MKDYLSIGQASQVIGVCVSTLRRWEQEERFLCDYRTAGGHRRYSLSRNERELLCTTSPTLSGKTVVYARVSSHAQKLDLKRQENRLATYCKDNDYPYELISDLGSGLNFKKKGLNKLLKMICQRQVKRLVLTHKDRLLRFGSKLLFKICEYFGTQIIILEKQLAKSFEQELTADVIELMTVFTAKIHGKRSHQNRVLSKAQAA